jgi:hypothetical protein
MDWLRRKKDDSTPHGVDRDAPSADLVERLRATGLEVGDAPGAEELKSALESEGWAVLLKKGKNGRHRARASKPGATGIKGRRLRPAEAVSAGTSPATAVAKLYLKLHPAAPAGDDPADG